MSNLNYRYLNQHYQPNIGAPAPSNMSSQRFCLRWNNHQSNLLSVFDQLLHDESFVDVTLAVEGQLLRAHKMVLSACSPYFQALFVNHPDKHPIVILKDVPYSDMKCLLDFMYRGEVSVDQDRLTAFLRVAESLRIKGLTEVNEEKCDIPSITSSLMQTPHHHNSGVNPPPHLHRIQQVHKRFGQMMNPLLGSALMQPKRKRGRPRKLSGSSNGTPGAMGSPAEDFDNRVGGDLLVQGSPEMLEVKMGMDGFGAGGNTDTDSSTGGRQEGQDNEEEPKIKEEEPIAGTSKDQDTKSQDDYNSSGAEGTVTVHLVPVPIRLQETTVIMSSQSATEARTVPVIQSVSTEQSAQSSSDHESGFHFLTDDPNNTLVIERSDDLDNANTCEMDGITDGTGIIRSKSELLEYLIRDDGSVACKLCGEVLASRTHWYRHKYKLHVTSGNIITTITPHPPVLITPTTPVTTVTNTPVPVTSSVVSVSGMSPSPLFKCTHCNVFFKSRKGYMGHISARHSNDTEDEAMTSTEVGANETVITTETSPAKAARVGKGSRGGADWEQQREKEEKLVADIIDRVRKECEAQGAAVSRRGYSRRTTVMNSCN